jgi:hypothetical protein
MLSRRWCAVLAAAVLSVSVIGSSRADVIDFEDLVVGTSYVHDDVFVSGGVPITVATYYWPNGDPYDGGFSEVDNFGNAGGTGNELEVNNVNLAFDFGVELSNMSLLYGYFGGNVNFEVNGDFYNLDDFSQLPATVGGVDVTVTAGSISLVGSINQFAIGGQELWIDDVEWRPAPGPGGIALLGAALIATRRRRR